MSLCATYNTNLRERASHMMRIFSWAAMATLAIGTGDLAGAELPIWRGPAEPHKFIDSVGRRAVLMGHEDGTFEAWNVDPGKYFLTASWLSGNTRVQTAPVRVAATATSTMVDGAKSVLDAIPTPW